MHVFYILLVLLGLDYSQSADGLVVQTNLGSVMGNTIQYRNKLVRTFLGIPYAEPPIGELRFLKPKPLRSCSGVVRADTMPPGCIQFLQYEYPWYDSKPGNSEDCLYLNIWVPVKKRRTEKMNVMVWFYTGGFVSGSIRLPIYDGHVLASDGDVIVVTVNYRLGAFGFLTSEANEVPGNMGLYDMLEGLRWVHDNIDAFGGDRNKVTLFGHSAGSIAVGLFCMSPLTKGLFRNAIMESGSPATMGRINITRNLDAGQALSKALGCERNGKTFRTDPLPVIECLRGKDANLIAVTLNSLRASKSLSLDVVYGDELLPMEPLEAVRSGQFHDANILIGDVQDEGSQKLAARRVEIFGAFGEKNGQINRSTGELILLEEFKSISNPKAVVQHYLNGSNEDDYDEIRHQVYTAMGDYSYFCPNLFFAESNEGTGNSVYFYYFIHRSSKTPFTEWMGVTHVTDVPYVFGRPLVYDSGYTQAEKNLSRRIIRFWTNFAKYGNPGRTWHRFSREDQNFRILRTRQEKGSDVQSHVQNCEFFRSNFGFP